ncbi:MAG: rod shape-determining protein MreC [Bdellovibrionales bacterium]|nr:rod shape-determining protein MreC [Bdellovibrionales bacterium]
MNIQDQDPKRWIIIAFFVGLPLLSINVERNSDKTPWFLKPFSLITSSVQSTYASFSSGIRGTTNLYLNLVGIKTENRQLMNENGKLRAQLGELEELRLENQRLSKMLDFRQKTSMKLLAAKVIGRDLIQDHSAITINRGTSHGLQPQMAVITSGGAVGYVIQPERATSKILLLTDRYSSIDAIVQRSRARGFIEGRSKSSCRMTDLQRRDNVQEGDLIVSSGLDNIFPKGFPIGTVTKVDRSRYGISPIVEVKPVIDPFTLEEVFIVINANYENFEKDPPLSEEEGEKKAEAPIKQARDANQQTSEPAKESL